MERLSVISIRTAIWSGRALLLRADHPSPPSASPVPSRLSDACLDRRGRTWWYNVDIGKVALDHFLKGTVQSFSQVVNPLHSITNTELVGL